MKSYRSIRLRRLEAALRIRLPKELSRSAVKPQMDPIDELASVHVELEDDVRESE